MIDFLTSRPLWFGVAVWIAASCAVGLGTYYLSRALIKQSGDNIKGATNNLFRVFGFLFSLMMSLSFTQIVGESREVERAVRIETAAIADALQGLGQYDDPAADQARATALEYIRLVVEDDWPALEDDRLGEEASAALGRLVNETLALEPGDRIQEQRWVRILDDIDVMSDARQGRLNAALTAPSIFFYVLVIGFVIIMVLFGLFKPRRTLVVLLAIYSGFIGLLAYLILALNDPFHGPLAVDPDEFVKLLEVHALSHSGG